MICDKKYKEKHSLKSHLVLFHLGLKKVEDDKDPMKAYEAALDPLGGSDPLSAEIEAADPFSECQESDEKANLDTSSGSLKLQEVNIESIKASADLNNGEANGDKSNLEISSESVKEVNIESIKVNDDSESVKEVNIESIKANGDLTNGNSESKESSPEILPVLTDKEKELLTKMFYHLRKYGCAFCTERYAVNLLKFRSISFYCI